MYSHERFLSSLSRPRSIYVPSPQARIKMDNYAYRPELPQGSTTEDSLENRNGLLPASDMKEFSSCFTPYVASITSPPISYFLSGASEQRHFENEATHLQCNGVREDEGRRDREHKKRSKNWTRLETLKLIKERSEFDAQFARSGRKSELWDAIAELLQRDSFVRDAQQCKDKWEKLSAGYKEVREGVRNKADFPYYDELHMLSFGRSKRGERANEVGFDLFKEKQDVGSTSDLELELGGEFASTLGAYVDTKPALDEQRKELKHIPTGGNFSAVQELMETLLAKQQRFFMDLLNVLERREQVKEKIRQEREDRWRAEDRAQRCMLNNTMVLLAQKVLDGHSASDVTALWTANEYMLDALGRPKKRPKFCEE